ncbi:MAG: right-handed parallel beta-helix repeat-containing protein, partial [Phycisphaerales bacterium]
MIKDNIARGGCGGNGGDGSNPNDGSGTESWGGDGGNGNGDGVGGGIYCDDGSSPVITDCQFINNIATVGIAGTGGNAGPGADLGDPYPSPAFPGFPGSVIPFGDIAGGAAYYDSESDANFTNCTFSGNTAYEQYSYITYLGLGLYDVYDPDIFYITTYTKGGALYSTSGNTISLRDCEVTDSLGGAVYCEPGCVLDIDRSSFRDNSETIEGGAIYAARGGFVDVNESGFMANFASGHGGAIRTESDANFTDCSFGGNRAGGNGGAIEAYIDTNDPDTRVIVTLNFESCNFGGNQAIDGIEGWGGGVHFRDFNATFTDCYFIANTAKNGGGLFLTGGTVTLTGGSINGNKSIGGSGIDTGIDTADPNIFDPYGGIYPGYGYLGYYYVGRFGRLQIPDPGVGVDIGGGLVCADTGATIENCTLSDNVAEGGGGSGGAINFYGGPVKHLIKNCLLTGNSANAEGGAISCNVYAAPEIMNCTFGKNVAGSLGGAVFCDWSSDITISDSIFQDNNSRAIAEEDFGNSIVKYCLFHNNSDGDYGFYSTATQQTGTSAGPALDVTNIAGDPLFMTGPLGGYYLSQIAAGQTVDSLAVDAGSDLAAALGLSDYTTRTDGTGDLGTVDLGYHYRDHSMLPLYNLTASVVGGHGKIKKISPASHDPNKPNSYYGGTPVTITAEPESGWRVAKWSGTSDDASKTLTNVVVMGPDRHVTVEFDQPKTIVVGSDPNYTSIQHAIDAAGDGDVVIVPTGTYTSVGPYPIIQIIDKDITLTGINPDDPEVVEATALRGYRFYISNVGPDTIIDGLTFRDSHWFGISPPNPDGPPMDGPNGGSVEGGAMVLYNASPTIRNCMFRNCSVTGGDGAPGDGGNDPHPVGFDGGWAGWAYGGAVFCSVFSNPTFQNCSFIDCFAQGGNGGNGGAGANNAQGGRGGNWEWPGSIEDDIAWSWLWDGWEWGDYDVDGNPRTFFLGEADFGYYKDYWKYSGYGGAIYCENYSSPKFIDCRFANNNTYGGVCGIGGTTVPTPSRNLNIENFGGTIYACYGSSPEFTRCLIRNSSADTTTVGVPDDIYVSYGGAVAFEDDCSPKFTDCTITTSDACIGGAMWWSDSSVTIVDCNITNSTAYHGAGLYSVDATGTITGSTIAGNQAFRPLEPNDPTDPNVAIQVGMVFGQGGGYYCLSSTVEVTDSIFAGNEATASGGGIYFGGSDQSVLPGGGSYLGGSEEPTSFSPWLHNSLVIYNIAGRDGGGISSNWYAEPIISNCTIANNEVTGAVGYGGGLFCGYDSNTVVIDSIIWDNIGVDGSQIAIGTGAEYEPRPSRLNITYSDIQPDPDPNLIQPPRALDVVFCIDTTGSMWDDIDAVKAASLEIIDRIAAANSDFRIAVVDYRDFPEDPYGSPGVDYPFNDVLGFETDVAAIQAGIDALALGAGADWRESVYSGLMHVIDGNSLGGWRNEPDVARAIILIGDAPPHDPEPNTDYTLADVIAAANAGASKSIFAIPVDGHPITTAYFTSLAEGTGGAVPEAADATEVVDAVMEAISLVWRPPLSIYIEENCRLNWWNADSNTWEPDSHNIAEDPLFIAGYYLSQRASGQLVDSPAVDAGSADANDPYIALHTYTTRTDGVRDASTVDMGYHYRQGLTQYRVTVSVIEDPNDPGIHGYVDPNVAVVYKGFGDNVVTLTAVPDSGYKVRQWTGTDDDISTSRINTVTVTEDTHVTVEFEPAPLYNFAAFVIDRGDGPHGTIDPNIGSFFDGTIISMTATPDPNYEVRMWYGSDDDTSRDPNNVVTVQGADVFVAVEFGPVGQNIINLYNSFGVLDRRSPFPTIQAAIDAAQDDFTVVLSDGVYKGPGNYNLNLQGGLDPNDVRPITVRSENGPENCILDAEGLGRLFICDNNEPNEYVIDGLTLTGGSAEFGGAILIDNASPTIRNCRIVNNTATGDGGAIWMTNSSPIITNTEITNNTSGGFGGGIYAEAGSTPEIINCLITFNTSADIGGAIYVFSSDATINLCTIAFNTGLDYGDLDPYPNPKGGIAARDSDPTITNCIIGRSGGPWGIWDGTLGYYYWGDTFSAGDDLYNCEATFSCIENEDDDGDGVIHDDPLWVTGGLGDFYLSQFIGGQPQNSPCVNAGEQYVMSTLQATYNLGSITTSIVNATDVGFADMGYHYPFFTGPPIQYSLVIYVSGNGSLEYTDANGVSITVEPNELPAVYYAMPGERVSLKAIPDPGYRVSKWTGTDDDVSVAALNSVSMYGNRTVFIEFESAAPRILNVSADGQYTYLGIQDAIDDAKEGDVIVLHSGTYAGTGFEVIGKNITITGTNPDDPNVVASTIIDCTGEREGGIHIVGAPGGISVLNGVTIMNADWEELDSPGPQDPGDRGFDGSDIMAYAYMDTTIEGAYTGSGYIYSNSAITVFGNHIISN